MSKCLSRNTFDGASVKGCGAGRQHSSTQ